MIKVLIVEDEPLIAKALAKLIVNSGLDFEVAGIAENGMEAIELYEKHLPEVVFSDIKMPIMDGFEFLQILKDRKYEPCTIILSGFEDFNYARQAISYQVLDYLLKPISKQMLMEILNKVRIISLHKEQVAKNNLIKSTLENKGRQEIIDGDCMLALICIGAYPMSPDDSMLPGVKVWSEIDLEGELDKMECSGATSWIFNGNSSVERILILEAADPFLQNMVMRKVYNRLQEQTNLPVTLITHKRTIDITSVGPMYNELKVNLYSRFIFGKSAMICLEDKDVYYEDHEINTIVQMIYKKISANDSKGINDSIKELLEFCDQNNLRQKHILKYLNIILAYYCEKFPLAQMTNIDFEFMLSNAESYDILYLEITEMLRTSLTLPELTQTVHPLALKIKDYLEENFEKSVTNEILSREFGFVSSYLSKIFKNQYRMTPGNYLIKLRINKAKSLIRENPERLIKDIADTVGYNDPYYFSKVFYKEENIWPSDYK